MRIADKMQFEQVKANIAKNRSQMSELQNQAATQKRVTKPSDDPLAASRVLANRIDLQGNRQFGKNLAYARSFLEYTDQSLGDLTELVVRAKELALSQSSDAGSSEQSRRMVAAEIEQLRGQLSSIGNRKLGDRFIFGGFNTQAAPFSAEGQYAGDSGEMNIHVDKETFVAMNVPGARVFLGEGVDRDGLAIKSEAQPKSIEELEQRREQEQVSESASQSLPIRGPSSVGAPQFHQSSSASSVDESEHRKGLNLFHVLRDLEISLRTNDKAGIQDSLDTLDEAMQQVVLTRAQVGSRSMILDQLTQTLEKAKVDNQSSISALEDADVFSTVSDINKTESTLQATLQTSGKLIQPSLMDFLR
jgi:flagellar hook-associated protein 3 FlgL